MGSVVPSGIRLAACVAPLLVGSRTIILGADGVTAPVATVATRPAISSSRWDEDWLVLADLTLHTEPLDAFKYVPLSAIDPKSYLSLGLNLRKRFESNDAPAFGSGESRGDSYLLQLSIGSQF